MSHVSLKISIKFACVIFKIFNVIDRVLILGQKIIELLIVLKNLCD